jgi:hypothetical protein
MDNTRELYVNKFLRADTQKQQCNLCIQQTDENDDAVNYNENEF